MRWALSEFSVLILALVAVAVALAPNFSSRNRVIAIACAVLTISLTVFQYYLLSYTGRGLFERAACLVFPSGHYCQAAGPIELPPETPQEPRRDDLTRLPTGYGFRECDICPAMVLLGGGTYLMGTPDSQSDGYNGERPQHEVRIARFALGRHEVTNEEWDGCVRARACAERGSSGDRYPVIRVTWDDTQDYIAWLNTITPYPFYRLPTEAEWEYAARAGTTTQFYWGSSADDGCAFANMWGRTSGEPSPDYANCSDGYPDGVAPVGSYRANRFRLFDMIGNAWEWVEDCYIPGYAGAPSDGRARITDSCESHVLRGGSYITYSRSMRVSFRGRDTGEYTINPIGFRIARSITTADER